MNYIAEGFAGAFKMIVSLDKEMIDAAFLSVKVSFSAIFLATLFGVPLGFYIGINEFRAKKAAITMLNTLLSFPTVLVGLMVYMFISRSGPLGGLNLLYTPSAMVIGQFIMALPIVAALSLSSTVAIDKRVRKTAVILGADKWQSAVIVFKEGRFGYMAAIIAAFGRIFGEVGAAMMLGGNIKGYTRNITTAITLNTGKGEFSLGIALGIILLAIALLINISFNYFQNKRL